MKQTSFHDFYNARVLKTLPLEEKLLPVYASSNIKIYPFQIAAADFALRSRYQKGVVLFMAGRSARENAKRCWLCR